MGVAFGRIGDLINGEHYGPRSDFFLARAQLQPRRVDAELRLRLPERRPYEMLLATLIFLVVWPLRHRVRRPGAMVWLVLGLFAAGRFVEFFVRSDSPALALALALGLNKHPVGQPRPTRALHRRVGADLAPRRARRSHQIRRKKLRFRRLSRSWGPRSPSGTSRPLTRASHPVI